MRSRFALDNGQAPVAAAAGREGGARVVSDRGGALSRLLQEGSPARIQV